MADRPNSSVGPGKNSANAHRQSNAQKLQNEIDKLALLLHETKLQSDKIQAMADALGESIFDRFHVALTATTQKEAGRKSVSAARKPAFRSRGERGIPVPPEASDLPAIRT